MNRMKLLLLADSEMDRLNIVDTLKNIDYIQLAGDFIDEAPALELLRTITDGYFVDGSGRGGDRYAFAERVSTQYPGTGIIMMEESLQEETMHNALFAGVKDVLIKPIEPEKLMNAIYRIHQLQEKKVALQQEMPQKKVRKSELGQVYTVFSTKEDQGKPSYLLTWRHPWRKVRIKESCSSIWIWILGMQLWP